MYPRLFQTGPLLIPTYGAMAAVGLVCALLLAMRAARRMGMDPDAVWDLGLTAVLSAFIGSRVLMVATNWSDFLHFPLLMLAAVPAGTGIPLYGGLVAGAVAVWLSARSKKMPLLRTLDALAPGLALGWGILMLGCLAAGSCFGVPTDGPLGIVFHAKYAALWYGTPLGVALQPTQIYEAAAEFAICGVLLAMLHRRSLAVGKPLVKLQDGEVFGAWLFLGAAAHFVIEFYRGDAGRGSLFGGLMTVTQGLALLVLIEGGALWMDRGSKGKPAAYAFE